MCICSKVVKCTCEHSPKEVAILSKRDAVRVTEKFKNFFKHFVTDPDLPYKIGLGTLTTLTVFQFWKKFKESNSVEQKKMFQELKDLQEEAEKKGFLKNSREISENENE